MEIPTLKHHLDIFQVAEQLGIKVDTRPNWSKHVKKIALSQA